MLSKLLILLLLGFPAWAGQSSSPAAVDVAPEPSARFHAEWYPADSDVSYTEPPVTGAPFSATMVTTIHFLMSRSGEAKEMHTRTLQARDWAGRTRTEEERPRIGEHGQTVAVHEVSVNDPVSHCSFRWEEPWAVKDAPIAIVTCLPRTLHYSNGTDPMAAMISGPKDEHSSGSEYHSEPLGRRLIEGVEAEGARRTTMRIDAGKPLKLMLEVWYSRDLHEMLVMKQIPDPGDKSGERTLPDFELVEIHRGEPDARLFYPPDGYLIKPGT